MTAERWIAGGILLAAVFLWIHAGTFESGLAGYSGIVGPRIFPRAILAALAAAVAFDLVRSFRGRDVPPPSAAADTAADPRKEQPRQVLAAGLALGLTCAWVALLPVLGFLVATLAFQLGLMFWVFGRRRPAVLAVTSVAMTGALFVIFGVVMGTPLPRGRGVFQSLSRLLH